MSVSKDLPKVLRASIRKHHVPGASVAVLRGDRIVAATAAGVVNLDTGVPATKDSVFQIGSITKIFTTTLIMQLVDEKKIDLDEPIITYLPKFRTADLSVSTKVTPRHFLSHQSGIDGDFFIDSGRGEDAIEKLVDMATMVPSLFPIGDKHSYCNLGFSILGRAAEVITGKTYDTLLRERIFEPLGMDHAFSRPEDGIRYSCAIGHIPKPHRKNAWQVAPSPYLTFGQVPAGSTPAMSATDLLKFAHMHMNGGRSKAQDKVLSARSVKAMLRRQIKLQKHSPAAIAHWGLGWFLIDWKGKKLHGHDGGTVGQSAFLRILPENKLAVALFANGGDAGGLFQDIYGHLFQGLASTSPPKAPEPDALLDVDLERYLGRYANMNFGLELTKSRGQLRITERPLSGEDQSAASFKMAFIDENTAVLRTGDPIRDRATFLFSDQRDGKMEYLSNGLRQLRRVH